MSFARQPLIAHFIELKKRLIICLSGFFIASVVCYFLAADIYSFLVDPLAQAFPDGQSRRMIYTSLTEAFFTYLRLAVFAGFIVSFPLFSFQLYRFIAPGLYLSERRAMIPYLIAAPLLFLVGAAFVYYLVFPAAWKFFLGFETINANESLPIMLEAKVSDYLSLVMHLIIAFGISFQLPVIMVLLVKSGVMQLETLKNGRRYAIVGIVTIAAFITPPDIFSQIALSVPLYVLYELAIIFCSRRKIEKGYQ